MAHTSIAGEVSLPGRRDYTSYTRYDKYFRGHVSDRACVYLVLSSFVTHACNSEVHHLNSEVPCLLEQHILQLEVPVDYTPNVTVVHSVDDLEDDLASV